MLCLQSVEDEGAQTKQLCIETVYPEFGKSQPMIGSANRLTRSYYHKSGGLKTQE
jgi:hypothetical protein